MLRRLIREITYFICMVWVVGVDIQVLLLLLRV